MQPPLFDSPPDSLCVLRLSALGDVCHALPVVRTIQDAWPGTRITWVLGGLEHRLLGHIPGIEFVGIGITCLVRFYHQLARLLDVLFHLLEQTNAAPNG